MPGNPSVRQKKKPEIGEHQGYKSQCRRERGASWKLSCDGICFFLSVAKPTDQ